MALSLNKILTEEQAAEGLGISVKSLQRLRVDGKVRWHSLMGHPRYYEDEIVEDYLNDQLDRGSHDPREDNKIRRKVRGKGQVREEGVLEKIYLTEGSK